MSAVVVALALQVAWMVARVVLEHVGIAAKDVRVMALTVAILVASYVTLAVAAGGLAKRLRAKRRLGAWTAVIGSLAMVVAIAVYEALLHCARDYPDAMRWAIAIRENGWSIVDALMILGFGIAAGRRGLWLTPPAIGLALANAQPGVSRASWSAGVLIALIVVKAVLLVLLAAAAESAGAAREPRPELARRGFLRFEVCAWLWIAIAPVSALAWIASPTFFTSFTFSCIGMALDALFISAAWSLARAKLATAPSWPWYASFALCVCAFARMFRSWGLTFESHWGDLAATPLKEIGWYAAVPGVLAALFALGAVAVYAHRNCAREATRAAVAAATFSAIAFAAHIALPGQTWARVVCSVIANIAAVLAYRVARAAIRDEVPSARVV